MPESCGNCYDTHLRKTARVYICERCGAPARECRRCFETRHDWGLPSTVETCAPCSLEHEMRDGWGPS
jgi:hypothetical protein